MFLSGSSWVLSPCYDLLNVKIILPKDQEDLCPAAGREESELRQRLFRSSGRLSKPECETGECGLQAVAELVAQANQLIDASFLNEDRKSQYKTCWQSA